MNRAERIAKRIAAAGGGSKTRLNVTVRFDEGATDAESLATAMDILMETALSTPGILDDYGNPTIGKFFVDSESVGGGGGPVFPMPHRPVRTDAPGQAELWVDVEYDDAVTDPESLATAMDILMETALSTPSILDDYGDVTVGEFLPPQIQAGPEAVVHILLPRGGAACGAAAGADELNADINYITCPDCLNSHDRHMRRFEGEN